MKKICALVLALCMLLALSACGAPKTHEVRFELNGGTLVSGELLQEIEDGGSAEAPKVERDGYVFAGWNKELENVKENLVAVALWTRQYTVSFDANGGELVSGELEQKVAEGELPQAPELERKYAAFDGWSPEISETKGDVTYVAQWTHTVLSPEVLFEYISPAVVEITVFDVNGDQFALGSGFFIDEQGTLATNYHVIEDAYSATAQLSDGSKVDITTVKAYDAALDLAIVQADVASSQPLVFAEQGVKTGETVYALGSSQGLTGSFSEGIVSTAARDIDGVTCIQTTAPISHGNSGGPLVNVYGEVVGVNSMTMELGQNLNFAIDIKELGKLEPTLTLSMAEFYEETAPEVTSEELSGYWYDNSDYNEVESNDTIMLADALENGSGVAGELPNIDDIDCFYFRLDSQQTVALMAAPYYKDDLDYFGATLFMLGDDDLIEVAGLQRFEAADGEFLYHVRFGFGSTLELQPGVYFLALYLDDSYWDIYAEPSYYITMAEW